MNFQQVLLDSSPIETILLFILVILSMVSWIMIFQRMFIISRAKRRTSDFEEYFWSGIDLTRFYKELKPSINKDSGIQNVFMAGFREFSRFDQMGARQPDVLIESIQRMMRIAIQREEEYLMKHLQFLASIGSVAPYIGLLGTVSGVMKAFVGLGGLGAESATLTAIAPGIAQALIATAMGLLAAIPAVWAYNLFVTKVNFILSNYDTFADEFTSVLNRKIRQQQFSGLTTNTQSFQSMK